MKPTNQDPQDVLHQIADLAPRAADQPRREAAWSRLHAQLAPRPARRRRFWHGWLPRPALAWSAAALLAILLFSFPAVRAAASEFLGLFRVQKFAAVSISPEQIAILQQVAENGTMPGELIIDEEPGELIPVQSLAEAARFSGLAAVRTLPALGAPDEIYVAGGGNGRFIIDLSGARDLIGAAGADPALLPASLDGAAVDLTLYGGVHQLWAGNTMLLQTESPLVTYPDDLDPVMLGQALLQVLGLNELEAFRLAQQIDWTSTLLLPVPSTLATFSEVSVDGVSGMALTSLDGEGNAIVWQEGGILYLLVSDQPVPALVDLANDLR